jgi:hypothetical protein
MRRHAQAISADQVLRDRLGRYVGVIRRLPDGRLEARDRLGACKSTYDPRTNQTRDAMGRLVGTGNLLPALIAGR